MLPVLERARHTAVQGSQKGTQSVVSVTSSDTEKLAVMDAFLPGVEGWEANDPPLPLAQPIEASLAKPDLNAPTSVSISASVIGVENVHVPVLMMMQPSL